MNDVRYLTTSNTTNISGLNSFGMMRQAVLTDDNPSISQCCIHKVMFCTLISYIDAFNKGDEPYPSFLIG